ncbi:aldolase/citrate lyase family protein [Endozoicomonas sp. 4G]|uniref:HpcH/HpaI aldolase family protein n=1 Tax=Endozoicomonas sp. 4G TaxID=2872754 RepID=UPI0020786361|nr:aldolase/citrate lyase family protein [Endozoicomonas sp. 4G]
MKNLKELITNPGCLGTFVKTPHPHIVEVLALTGLDFIILDAEHAPFDRQSLDLCILAARAANLPCLVRVQNDQPSSLLNALDSGADGVLVPHVCSPEQARNIVKSCHYGHGGRGYAGSTRVAGYTTRCIPDHLRQSRTNTTVIVQIEDPEGVDNVDSIAATEGVDALFIGQVDLAVAYGEHSLTAQSVTEASLKICSAGRQYSKPVGMFLGNHSDIPHWQESGVQFFGYSSEQKIILDHFKALTSEKSH